jgi:hypothetical protein
MNPTEMKAAIKRLDRHRKRFSGYAFTLLGAVEGDGEFGGFVAETGGRAWPR